MLNFLKVDILQNITRAIQQGRSGNDVACHEIIAEIEMKVARLDDPDREKQRQILNRIRQTYPLKNSLVAAKAISIWTQHEQSNAVSIPVGEFAKEIKSGVSLVTCCMNRSENMLKAMPSWLACPEISQIIIVDWSSKNHVRDEVVAAGFDDERILVARVCDQPRWILSYAYNFGFRLAGYDKILKTDADIMLRPGFFRENDLKEKTFLSGDWRIAEKGQEHINGFFFIRRDDLFSIMGFNEYITTYGWDDDDIYFRMEQQGLNRVRIKPASVYHIPHDDAQRVGDSSKGNQTALEYYRQQPGTKIMGNRFIAAAMPMWDQNKFFVPFEITNLSKNYVVAHQSGESWCQVPSHIKDDADYYGMVARLSWEYTLEVYTIKKPDLYALLAVRGVDEITSVDVRLCVTRASNNIDWHRNTIVVLFKETVPWEKQQAVIEYLLATSRQHKFTLVAPPGLFSPQALAVDADGIYAAIELPQGFWTYAITELSPDSLCKLPEIFNDSPAFFSTVGEHDAFNILNHYVRASNASPQHSQLVKQNRIPAIQSKKRFYIDVQHGLGNRLRAFASAACIAKQTDRELIVIWKPDHHCECNFRDLFNYDGEVIAEPPCFDTEQTHVYNYMEIEPGSCKDKYIPMHPGVDLYVKSAYVINNELSSWSKENSILQQLRPADSVMELVNTIDIMDRVGIHVRMEGAKGLDLNSYDSSENWKDESHQLLNEWRGKSHYSAFMKRIDNLIVEEPSLKLFLAADMKEVYPVFLEKYGNRLVYLPRDAYDRSIRQLRYGLADAILLSRCNLLLGSTWSSFTELAQRLSTTIKRVEMSGVDF